jgi:hypothetical protein
MTDNVYEGTDITEVASATNLAQLLVAVGATISQVRATDPPSRMLAVAKQIAAAAPALVSAQEVDQWYSGPFDPVSQTCSPVSLEFDMLQELTDASGPDLCAGLSGFAIPIPADAGVNCIDWRFPMCPATQLHSDIRADRSVAVKI